MVSYLDLLNKARRQNGDGDISLTGLQTNAQGSQSQVEYVDEIVSYAYERSQDWGFNDIIATVTTTIGSGVVTAPSSPDTAWEPDAIKEVRLVQNNQKNNLYLITPSRADQIEAQLDNAEPLYWYVDNAQELKLLPIPDAVYTLTVRYQGLVPQITDQNINDTIVLPITLQKAIVQGVYA